MYTPATSRLRYWKPLLDHEHAQAALASIHEIAMALERDLRDQERASGNPELGAGAAGIATFFAYLQTAGLFAGAGDLALQYLNIGIDALAGQPMGPSLYAGFTGIAWAVEHVNNLLTGSSADMCSEIDLALELYLNRSPWKEDYDLVGGLVGVGVYCLERGGAPVTVRCLELIVERLSELAEASGDGLRWFTRPNLLPQQQREIYPQGYYNLGLAHGVPGIIALLGRIQAAGVAQEQAGRLLEGAVCWLLRQKLPDHAISCFDSLVSPDQPAKDARMAWCYGDVGLAAALFLAARHTGTKLWEQRALSIAQKAARREPHTSGVIDSCFCHGSAGLAHIFNRFYQATNDELFSRTACYWIERTLQFRKPGTGAAGYSVMTPRDDGELGFQGQLGIIEGIAGVGLSLLAAITGMEPCWDRVFIVDIPPLSIQA
ncbi:MAG TPA: lanthionine synthetase C family protein [Candidatus Angelobacter sp.]|nr:lanthionine synthetase C family protein [Candidatus Angelobacter sp.]